MQETRFGNWLYDSGNLVLRHDRTHYEVDLERCTTSAQVLDWICQVTDKVAQDMRGEALWKAEDLFTLVFGLNKLLCPQEYLCSQGYEEGPMDATRITTVRLPPRPDPMAWTGPL